jgi:hypothetical protein
MPSSDYRRLEERLVLVAWLNSLFGYEHNRDMLRDLADVGEGVDSTGRSHAISRLLSRGEKCLLPESELVRYDRNIRQHLAAMNRGRMEKITLRYFQYLAEAGVLDGDRKRQDAADAPELPAVPALQPEAVGQRVAGDAERGVDSTAP